MTRANTDQIKHIPWFAKAGAACSIVPIARFVGPNIFTLKGGGYGCLFSLTGIDEEGVTDLELDARARSIEGALRGLPEGSCLYQYSRVMSGFDLPRRAKYANPITEVFASDRLDFLNKSAAFRRIDLHWCLTLEPSRAGAFERKPPQNAIDTSRLLADLNKTATILQSHLGGSLGLRLLDKTETFQFFSYLFNLEEWGERDQLRSDEGVDRQIVKSPVAWHSDHVQVGKRHVQMFSLKTTPEASRPCLFSSLLTIDCDSVLCSTWRVKSTAAARSEIDAQEKFISFFKVGVLTRVMSGRDTSSLDTGAGAKAANINVDDLSEVIRGLDKKAQGEFSLRLLLAARSPEHLRDTTPAVHRIFVDARAQVMEETLGNLSAFYAMFPGNHKFNVFPLWLSEDHHARLSSVFAPNIGHPHSDDLDSEYLNIFETRTRTPFFQDVYVDGVRVMLIIGPTGSGKSVHGNAAIALEQKYGGFTYIFDIGGSYESVVELYGGKVDRVGKDGPRVNPFALEPTESNIKFLYSFIKLLLTNGGAELEPEDDDVIHKAVQDIDREIAARPELVQIEASWRSPKEQRLGALQKNQYRELDIADNPDAEPPCSSTKSAIIVFGKHAGRTLTVCTDTDCPVHNPQVAAQLAADPPPTIAPAPEQETEEEAAGRQAEYEQRQAEYDAEQQRKEEERKAEFERQQKQYEAEQARREKQRKARAATFERILANAPATFTTAQLRVFLSALVNLDPYDFAEDVAEYYVGGDENNQQTPEEVLSSTVNTLPDEKLTGFALRLVLTGHTDIPRESDFDFLAQAEAAFVPPQPQKAQRKKPKPTPVASPAKPAPKKAVPKKKLAA